MKVLRLLLAAAAVSVCASANAGTIVITPTLPGSVSGDFFFTKAGSETFKFTIPTPYTYDFSVTFDGLFTTSNSGAAGTHSYVESVSGPAVLDYTLTTAVPELGTWALMFLGFAGLGLAGYRGSKRSPAAFVAS